MGAYTDPVACIITDAMGAATNKSIERIVFSNRYIPNIIFLTRYYLFAYAGQDLLRQIYKIKVHNLIWIYAEAVQNYYYN